jgi:hypothetical protein
MIFTQQAAPTQHNTAGGTSGAETGRVCGLPCFFLERDELSGFAAAFPARDSLVSDPSIEAVCLAAQRLEKRAQGSQGTHAPGGLCWALLGTVTIEQRLLWRRASDIFMAMVESLVCFLFQMGMRTLHAKMALLRRFCVQFAT